MRAAWGILRSLALWTVSVLHFFVAGPLLLVGSLLFDPRKVDWPQRVFCRNVVRLAGMRLEVRRSPGFDASRPSIFICNHVNLFDAFVIYCAIPQFVRGLEQASHFRVPVYGWIMQRFGNIPVPKGGSHFPHILERVKSYIEGGTSVIVFPEGTRTRDGHVGRFRKGGFVMAQQLGVPVVPMSICGAFEFNRKGGFMLAPGPVVVHLHDTIDPGPYSEDGVTTLMDHVRSIVSKPVDHALEAGQP